MDLAAVKARLAQLNNKNSKKSSTWKPKDEHDVRLLPQKSNADPFVERLFHYDIGNNPPIICPRNFGDDCPICEAADKLRAWKDENGNDKPENVRKSEFEMSKKLSAKPRYFVAMVERGKEADGPMYWSITPKVYESLLKICANEDWNADREDAGGVLILTSPVAGHDIHVSFQKPNNQDGKGNKTTMFLTEVTERKKPSKLLASAPDVKKLLDAVRPLDELFPPVTTKEVARMFNEFINSMKTEPADGEKGNNDVEYNAPSNNAEKLTGTKNIDDALDDLVNGG